MVRVGHHLESSPMTIDTHTHLSPAEFRVTREHLGLSRRDVAAMLEVEERAVRRWDDGTSALPPGVIASVAHWVELTDDYVRQMAEAFNSKPGSVVLYTYRNDDDYRRAGNDQWCAGWHRAMIARVAEHIDVSIEYAGSKPV